MSTTQPINGTGQEGAGKIEILNFVFDLKNRRNYFTLYLGGISTALFFIIIILAFMRKRVHPVVNQLARPEADAHVHEYLVVIKTSYLIGAGLSDGARVAIELFGTFCNSSRFTLTQKYMKQKILKRAHCDIFVLYTPLEMGEVRMARLTLFNFSAKDTATWEELSFFKVVLYRHQWTSPFFCPQRFGAYTSFTNIMFFFFSQTTLLTCTLSAYILAHQFLGKLISGDMFIRFFQDYFPYTQIASAVVSVILQIEMLLHNMRPSPMTSRKRLWRGLWVNTFPGNLMQCNINYDWDRPPSEFISMKKRFSSNTSLSSVESEEGESDSSLPSSESDNVDTPMVLKPKVVRDAALRMIRYCFQMAKKTYTYARKPAEQFQRNTEIELGTYPIVYTGSRAVPGTTVTTVTVPLPRAYCQFCLWVKHLTVRGEDLNDYFLSLSHHMRRCITALRATKETKVATQIMTICVNQWLSSVLTRMLREVVKKLDEEQLSKEGLDLLLQDGLLSDQSNLWFAETGYLEGPLAGDPGETTSHVVSNTYFSILRQIVQMWKSMHTGVCSILKKPHEQIAPTMTKTKSVKWDTKIYKKNIVRITDLVDAMGMEDEPYVGEPEGADTGHFAAAASPTSPAAAPVEGSNQNTSNWNTQRSATEEGPTPRNASNSSSSKAEDSGVTVIGAVASTSLETIEGLKRTPGSERLKKPRREDPRPQTCPSLISPSGIQIEMKPLRRYSCESVSSGVGLELVEDDSQRGVKPGQTSIQATPRPSAQPCIETASATNRGRRSNSIGSDNDRNKSNSSIYYESNDSEAESTPAIAETLQLPQGQQVRSTSASLSNETGGERDGKELDQGMENQRIRKVRGGVRRMLGHTAASAKNRSNSNTLGNDGLRDRCQSNSESPPEHQKAMAGKATVSGKVVKLFQRKVLRVAGPSVLKKLCMNFESLANVVQYQVTNGRTICCCCDRKLCQTYAVVYSQLKEYGYKVVYHLAAHNMMRRDSPSHQIASVMQRAREFQQYVNSYIQAQARLLATMGRPYNRDTLLRLRAEEEAIAKGLIISTSYGSLDSALNLNLSANNPSENADSFDESNKEYRPPSHYEAHTFGKRMSHHGIMDYNWTHAAYPFPDIVYAPAKVVWPRRRVITALPGILSLGIIQGLEESLGKQQAVQHVGSSVDLQVPSALNLHRESTVDEIAVSKIPKPKETGLAHKLTEEVLHASLNDLKKETEWLLGLKQSLAGVIAFARIEITEELKNPLKIAVRQFTHALLILLFEGLLPRPDEETFVVTADDIRQRRKRVSSDRTPGLFDLTEDNDPGYDLNFLDFVVVKLCERWDMAKVEMQYLPTLMYLCRCLTMSNLNRRSMESIENAMLSSDTDNIGKGMTLTKMTHVHEVQHAVAVLVAEVMAMTLVYVVPETLKAITDIEGKLRNNDERVTYVCEKVTVMEHQVRHKLARRLTEASSRQVQSTLLALDMRQESINKRQTKMLMKLRTLVKEDDYYCQIDSEELKPIVQDLKKIRNQIYLLQIIEKFRSARRVSKYTRKTRTLEQLQVSNTLMAMTDVRSKDTDYSARQYAEVEWVVTGQMEKFLPSICMNLAMVFMFLGTAVNLFIIIVLGASLTPSYVGEWFGLHSLGLLMIILVCEPFKCLWYYDFGWQQPEHPDHSHHHTRHDHHHDHDHHDKDQQGHH